MSSTNHLVAPFLLTSTIRQPRLDLHLGPWNSVHYLEDATRAHPTWLLYMSTVFSFPCSPRLTRVRVSTSHQKVVLEIDFSGSLWVRALSCSPLDMHRSPQQRLLFSRDTPKSQSYQTIQTYGLFISILDSAVRSSRYTSVLAFV